MRAFKILFFLFAGVSVFLAACEKVADLPYYGSGTPAVLTASTTTIAAQPADSNNNVLTLTWTDPKHATDSASMKYVIEIDSSGKNFSNPRTVTVLASRSHTFTAKQLNEILRSYSFAFGMPVDMDVRVVSSYANNNERIPSNSIKIRMTPYKVPPKVVPPASNTLFLVGNATAGDWGNPVPSPAQKFTRLDSVTYEGTFYLNGGGQYLVLPNNGDWSTKYSVANNTLPGLDAGGDFGLNLNDNFPGPAATGTYKIRLDFQNGKFTVTKINEYGLLYMPGDYQGWDPASAHKLGSPNNDGNFEGYMNMPAGGSYMFKFTPGPSWNNAIGDGGSGTIVPNGGGDFVLPGAGYYKINVNTNNNTWSYQATTWGMIGDFNGWSGDAPMTYDAGSKSWKGTVTAAADGQFKFRANSDWGLNYGDNGADGSLERDGANLTMPAGTHNVTLFLNNAGYYTYKIE